MLNDPGIHHFSFFPEVIVSTFYHLGLIYIHLSATQDQLKVKKLTSKLISAIADANSGKRYGSGWVPSLGRALEEVQARSSRRNFIFGVLIVTVIGFCPPPPEYSDDACPCPKPVPSPVERPPRQSEDIVYPDGTYFPWCYPPHCPSVCDPPYCYPCKAPHCDTKCVPPNCYPPCKKPCVLPPTCWPPHCPNPCKPPKCIAAVERTARCVQPYCPPPRTCVRPYCPKMLSPRTRRGQNTKKRTARCPMQDIIDSLHFF